MKHFTTLAMGVMGLVLAACSNVEEPVEEISQPDQTQIADSEKDVYANLTIKLPTMGSSRANNGFEVGKDYENNVGKILVVLATKSDNGQYLYLTSATADAKPNETEVPANTKKYVLNFASKDMTPDALDKNEPGVSIPGSEVYVFAYCNPSNKFIDDIILLKKGAQFTDAQVTLEDKDNDIIWQPNHFLMTNGDEPLRAVNLPSREELVNQHNTPETAFPLGTVKVKRVAARFDFAVTNENKYDILDIDGETRVGTVELTEMAMFNIAKHFYYLPRSSKSWDWSNPELCGDLEEYVVSCDAAGAKYGTKLSTSKYRDHYFSNIVGNKLEGSAGVTVENPSTDDLLWTSIRPADWEGKTDDNNGVNEENKPNWSPDEKNYRIWRYASENTIPQATTGTTTSSQKVGVTTGVVFKGEFDPVNKTRWNGNDAVYVHNNIVYGNFEALKAYVEKNPNTLVAADFNLVDAFKGQTESSKNSLLKGVEESNRHNFIAYEPNEEHKYIMYYFYYNRHASNGNNSLMGDNEFGVVRNNVYKLAVTTCGRFGEPEATTEPDDPDEEENAYFTVSCLVMPWTVRVNNIEF